MTPPDNNSGDDFRVVKRLHFVFTETGLELALPAVHEKNKLIRITIDIPKPVYDRVEQLASVRKVPVETVILEWITQNAAA